MIGLQYEYVLLCSCTSNTSGSRSIDIGTSRSRLLIQVKVSQVGLKIKGKYKILFKNIFVFENKFSLEVKQL